MFTASGKSAAASAANYIEDVFSTYLYTGNGSTQTITNGIDLSTKGGLVWVKSRDTSIAPDGDNLVFDTVRSNGNTQYLVTNTTAAQYSGGGRDGISAWNTNGFTLSGANNIGPNTNTRTYASWTFRKQPKFFDIVTWVGDGTFSRNIPHSLASVPGAIFIKKNTAVGNWNALCQSGTNYQKLVLNATNASSGAFAITLCSTSTTIDVGYLNAQVGDTNTSGVTYVAYLFAHNAGGFGLTGTDNVISCGSYVGNGVAASQTINLGYEPQFVMVKASSSGGVNFDWIINDTMRGLFTPSNPGQSLFANSTGSEFSQSTVSILSNGFTPIGVSSNSNQSGVTYIYIAIRRGPMKTPTSGTSVFIPVAGDDTVPMTTGFPVDFALDAKRTGAAANTAALARLTGNIYLTTSSTAAEVVVSCNFASNTKVTPNVFGTTNPIVWAFGRAPGFMDVVCYTGTGSALNVSHNLGVVPELMIVKGRSFVEDWAVYSSDSSVGSGKALRLNSISAPITTSTYWNSTAPTASQFSVGASIVTNTSGGTLVAYLFATLAGVSKVGSYTGSGILQTIPCGFAAGARFVLIKRTDSTGEWYVWDSTRGITSGNDPYLTLNSTAAEVTGTNYVDTDPTGFKVTAAASTTVNVSTGTYIFLAIA